jgi:hypothetical protein
MSTQPISRGLITVAEAAAEASVSVAEILRQVVVGAYRAYGRRRAGGLIGPIPRNEFAELPTSRLPPGTRYATEAEMRVFEDAHASAICPWDFPELPAGVVAQDYAEQAEGYFRAFYVYPDEGAPVDTWFDVKASIIYADGKPEWTDVRVERLAPLKAGDLETSGGDEQPIYSTGLPGRRTSIQLIEIELDRRIAELRPGETLGEDIKEVATSLSDWLRTEHTKAPPATWKTIANNLREKIKPRIKKHSAQK